MGKVQGDLQMEAEHRTLHSDGFCFLSEAGGKASNLKYRKKG